MIERRTINEDNEFMARILLRKCLDDLSSESTEPSTIAQTRTIDSDFHRVPPGFCARSIVLCPNGNGQRNINEAQRSSVETAPIN
jgi:hypothetical protein